MKKMTSKVGLGVLPLCIVLALAGCAPKGEELYARAATSLANGDAKAAVIDLKNLVQAEPQNGKARALLGQALVASGELALGEVEILKAADLGVSPSDLLVARCRIMLAKAEFAEVLSQCKPESVAADGQST